MLPSTVQPPVSTVPSTAQPPESTLPSTAQFPVSTLPSTAQPSVSILAYAHSVELQCEQLLSTLTLEFQSLILSKLFAALVKRTNGIEIPGDFKTCC